MTYRIKSYALVLNVDLVIRHECINLLVPSVQNINIENPGNQVNYGERGLNLLNNFAGSPCFQY